MERNFKESGAKLYNDIMQYQQQKIEALDEFQKAIADKMHAKFKMSVFRQENEELTNFIQSAKEKRDNAEVRKYLQIKERET